MFIKIKKNINSIILFKILIIYFVNCDTYYLDNGELKYELDSNNILVLKENTIIEYSNLSISEKFEKLESKISFMENKINYIENELNNTIILLENKNACNWNGLSCSCKHTNSSASDDIILIIGSFCVEGVMTSIEILEIKSYSEIYSDACIPNAIFNTTICDIYNNNNNNNN